MSTHDLPASPAPPSPALDPREEAAAWPVRLMLLGVGVAILALAAWLEHGAVPVLLAIVVAALAPRRYGFAVRAPLAAMAGLLTLFVIRNWPGLYEAAATEGAPDHPSTVLTWMIAMPVLGALLVLVLPRRAEGAAQGVTLLAMLSSLGISLKLLGASMGRTYHFDENVAWIPRFGIHYHVAVDGISLWLVLLTTVVTPIAAYASFGSIHERVKEWCFSLLALEAGMLGSFVALDLFVFYVFWELMLIPMYVMIGVWGGSGRIKSSIKFFLYTMFGSVLMLGAILYLAYTYAKATGGAPSFDYFELQRLLLPQHLQLWLWAAFTLAFVIKVPMFPVHTWLPDAHTEAPTAGSVILAAVMLKMGTYGYLRFAMGLFPEAAAAWAPSLAGVAVLGGIIYGALCAWKQDDAKRLIAYSSVAHLGYVMLGLFSLTQASIEGAVLQMVNHGVSTGMLFLLFGVIYDRLHTRQLGDFGGLAKPMPVYAALFVIATLASIGVPGTNGFVGEFMIITGTFASNMLGHFNGVQATGAAFGVILGAVYMLMVVQKMFFGPVSTKNARLLDVSPRELLAVAPLAMLVFVIGFFPSVFLSQIHGAAYRVQDDMASRVANNPPPRWYEGAIKVLPRRPEAPPPPSDTAPGEAR